MPDRFRMRREIRSARAHRIHFAWHIVWHPPRSNTDMKVWIDQDLCTGDGLCEEIAPDVFTLLDDGLAYVVEGDKVFAAAKGLPEGAEGLAEIPDGQLEAVIESAEECPGECIYIEP
jgi:ferredoxin